MSSDRYIYGTDMVNKHFGYFWSQDYIVSLVTDFFLIMGLWLSKLVGALSFLAGSDRHVRILMLGLDAAGNISITQYIYIYIFLKYIEIRYVVQFDWCNDFEYVLQSVIHTCYINSPVHGDIYICVYMYMYIYVYVGIVPEAGITAGK